MELKLLRHLTLATQVASGHRHLSAASGLVAIGSRIYVVGDDETRLATFSIDDNLDGTLVPLVSGDLPRDAKARKAAKPDFETLILLSGSAAMPHGALLALGSGSTPRRRRGAMVSLDADGRPLDVTELDLSSLFDAVGQHVEEPNIEGAVVRDGRLVLFNRGNTARAETVVLACDLEMAMAGGPVAVGHRATLSLGEADGVPLTVTDACALNDGSIIVSAVAEDTSDSYNDGRLAGAAVCVLDRDIQLRLVERLQPAVKIEGIVATQTGDRIYLLMVSDADDPERPAGLFSATMRLHD